MLSILVTNNRSMSTLQKREYFTILKTFRYLELLLAIGLKSEICKTFQLFDG